MRSHLLEGKVRHRRSSPVEYALEHDVYYFALDLSELDAWIDSWRWSAGTDATSSSSATTTTGPSPPRTSARPCSTISGPEVGLPSGMADHPCDEPSCRSGMSSIRRASTSAGMPRASCAS